MSVPNLFVNLPEVLIRCLFCEWLDLKDLCILDSALCNVEFRDQFLVIARDCVFMGTHSIFDPNDDIRILPGFMELYIGWLAKRKLRIRSICINSDSLNAGPFLAAFGISITNLQFCRSGNDAGAELFDCVCIYCPNLLKVRFPRDISPHQVIQLGYACKCIQELNYFPMRGAKWDLNHYQAINAAYPCLTTITVCRNSAEVYKYVLEEFPKLQNASFLEPRMHAMPTEIRLTKYNFTLTQLSLNAEICIEVLSNILMYCPNIRKLDVIWCESEFDCITLYCPYLTHLLIHMCSITDTTIHKLQFLQEVVLSGYLCKEAIKLLKTNNSGSSSETVYLTCYPVGLTVDGVRRLIARGVKVVYDQDSEY